MAAVFVGILNLSMHELSEGIFCCYLVVVGPVLQRAEYNQLTIFSSSWSASGEDDKPFSLVTPRSPLQPGGSCEGMHW